MRKFNWNKAQDILLMQGSAFVLSFSNVCSKLAAREDSFSTQFFFYYGCSIFIMGIYAILWQQILKRVSMTTAYSNRMVTIVWGIIWGCLLFHERIKLFHLIGTLIIFIGLYILIGDEYDG